MLRIADFRQRVAYLRASVVLFGDCNAIEQDVRLSGLADEVWDMLDTVESDIGILIKQLEEDVEPTWGVAHRDFLYRVEQGKLVNDPLRGWIDMDHLRSIGACTRITDFSMPASHTDVEGKSYPICLETFTATHQAVRLSACSHVIDAVCLDTWVNSLAEQCNTCVLCRCELFTRRSHEPTGYLQWYLDLQHQYTELTNEIKGLRSDSRQLVEIMYEIRPSQVALSLGR
ncbi:hypothetical protein K458DRAFT_450536 [Lentithecium fluviatile CBS 122367]|uniref:RING-type domain-containing protein n=1 Tax=Lentithecium fluviatile CBS 122367 TaxID=1168545 RepID=A0A6G1J4P5_9PLEO|nr:hypothetical protein K458DRAFT_450536 [Lentithecium fluviatile CBS 122367]